MVPGGGMGSMGPAPPHGAQLHQFRGVTPPYVSTRGIPCKEEEEEEDVLLS